MSNSTNDAILNAIKSFLDNNEGFTKKEFLDTMKTIYDNNNKKSKKSKKSNDEKEKKPLNAYQEFMKEQRPIINARENSKSEDEVKLNTREIMKEIAEKWKLKKEGILNDTKEFLKSDEEEEKPKKEVNNEEEKSKKEVKKEEEEKPKKEVKKTKKTMKKEEE